VISRRLRTETHNSESVETPRTAVLRAVNWGRAALKARILGRERGKEAEHVSELVRRRKGEKIELTRWGRRSCGEENDV